MYPVKKSTQAASQFRSSRLITAKAPSVFVTNLPDKRRVLHFSFQKRLNECFAVDREGNASIHVCFCILK